MPYNFSRTTAMIVEDSLAIRRLFVDVLANFGVGEVLQCGDGSEALDELRDRHVDVIFSDWKMKPMGGIEMVRQIRAGAEGITDPYLPIVMLTSNGQRGQVEEARDAGATEFLVKPCTPHAIYARLVSLVERPRPFVRAPSYAGPDRRRKHQLHIGRERRAEAFEIG